MVGFTLALDLIFSLLTFFIKGKRDDFFAIIDLKSSFYIDFHCFIPQLNGYSTRFRFYLFFSRFSFRFGATIVCRCRCRGAVCDCYCHCAAFVCHHCDDVYLCESDLDK